MFLFFACAGCCSARDWAGREKGPGFSLLFFWRCDACDRARVRFFRKESAADFPSVGRLLQAAVCRFFVVFVQPPRVWRGRRVRGRGGGGSCLSFPVRSHLRDRRKTVRVWFIFSKKAFVDHDRCARTARERVTRSQTFFVPPPHKFCWLCSRPERARTHSLPCVKRGTLMCWPEDKEETNSPEIRMHTSKWPSFGCTWKNRARTHSVYRARIFLCIPIVGIPGFSSTQQTNWNLNFFCWARGRAEARPRGLIKWKT